ncbi:MAG: long-chain acyl-CoA synthetase [Gaiellaceae bacterium]|nr:long-chain acyl-CoA synthetase [Gaiellaceae bacterium]
MAEHNLAQLAEAAAGRNGEHESLWFEGRWYRADELFERARRVAAGLAEIGVEAGDRVVVMAANCPEVGIVYNALWRAGAAITPAIFLLPAAELRHIVVDSEASVVVASPEFLDTVRAAAEGVASVRAIVSTAELPEGDAAAIVQRADDDLAALMYTGGTTGRAKGVMLSHANLWHAGKSGHDAGYVPGVVRSLVALPLSHAFGLIVTVVALHSPERLSTTLLRWFDPEAFLRLAQEHEVQISAVVPSMLQALLAQPLEEYDLSSLRYVVSGAAPLPREVAEEFARRVPSVELREGYGLSETSAIVSGNQPGRSRLGTVGEPLPGVEVRIIDEAGNEVPRGEVGEICCRSAFVMLGYWRAPELTAAAIRDGWFHTGDLGSLDGDGYLTIVDRKKDLIIRGGFNVFPRDVEDALLEHPNVVAAGVVGRPDEMHGEEVVAFVSLQSGSDATPEELVAFGKQRIGGYKYPREVRIVPSLPLTPVGKLDRKSLRAML